MSKKRFVKLLMSIGYDRNTANNASLLAQLQRYTYEKRWREYKQNYSIKLAFRTLGNGIAEVAVEAKRLAEQFTVLKDALCPYGERKAEG